MSTTTNGRPQRKQLSEQIDRLDTLLDGLAEGLNDAISDAVREGTRLALKEAVIEILTDPTLRTRLQQAAAPVAPPPAAKPSFWERLKTAAKSAAGTVATLASAAAGAATAATKATINVVRHPSRLLTMVGDLKHLIFLGAGAAFAVAIVSYLAPHAVSASLSGITGGVAAVAIQMGIWTRRTIRVLKLV